MSVNLNICGVNLKYQAEKVVDNITFAVGEGEFLALLGPNGSGKSTLIKLLAKTLLPSGGAIYLGGDDLKKLNSTFIARQMAVVPQETPVSFSFTAREVVMMGRSPHLKRFQLEGKRDFEIVREAMLITKTWDLQDRLVSDLSGGEKQRVIIARALAQEPKILMLDEPTSHLDISFQVELLEMLSVLNKEKGVTVIVVLHDLNLAAQYCQKALLLNRGKIFTTGTPEQVITAKNIREVYDTEVIVWFHPVKNCPQVSVLGKEQKPVPGVKPFKVHLVCGGGVGIEVMERLCALGCEVSAGVLNVGDSDWVHAKKLDLPVVEEAPYSPISDQAFEKAKKMIESVDLVALLEIPLGPGNLKNIRLAAAALQRGIITYAVANDVESRDYTGGQGAALISGLRENGARVLEKGSDLINIVNQEWLPKHDLT